MFVQCTAQVGLDKVTIALTRTRTVINLITNAFTKVLVVNFYCSSSEIRD